MIEANSDVVDLSIMESRYWTYRDQPGALIPILQKAQDVCGFLLPEVLQWTADRMDVALGTGLRRGYFLFTVPSGGPWHVRA